MTLLFFELIKTDKHTGSIQKLTNGLGVINANQIIGGNKRIDLTNQQLVRFYGQKFNDPVYIDLINKTTNLIFNLENSLVDVMTINNLTNTNLYNKGTIFTNAIDMDEGGLTITNNNHLIELDNYTHLNINNPENVVIGADGDTYQTDLQSVRDLANDSLSKNSIDNQTVNQIQNISLVDTTNPNDLITYNLGSICYNTSHSLQLNQANQLLEQIQAIWLQDNSTNTNYNLAEVCAYASQAHAGEMVALAILNSKMAISALGNITAADGQVITFTNPSQVMIDGVTLQSIKNAAYSALQTLNDTLIANALGSNSYANILSNVLTDINIANKMSTQSFSAVETNVLTDTKISIKLGTNSYSAIESNVLTDAKIAAQLSTLSFDAIRLNLQTELANITSSKIVTDSITSENTIAKANYSYPITTQIEANDTIDKTNTTTTALYTNDTVSKANTAKTITDSVQNNDTINKANSAKTVTDSITSNQTISKANSAMQNDNSTQYNLHTQSAKIESPSGNNLLQFWAETTDSGVSYHGKITMNSNCIVNPVSGTTQQIINPNQIKLTDGTGDVYLSELMASYRLAQQPIFQIGEYKIVHNEVSYPTSMILGRYFWYRANNASITYSSDAYGSYAMVNTFKFRTWAGKITGTNLPNLSGRFIMGSTTTNQSGQTGGSMSITQTVDQMPSHNHTIAFYGSGSTSVPQPNVFAPHSLTSTDYSTNNTGGGQAMDITNSHIKEQIYICLSNTWEEQQ